MMPDFEDKGAGKVTHGDAKLLVPNRIQSVVLFNKYHFNIVFVIYRGVTSWEGGA